MALAWLYEFPNRRRAADALGRLEMVSRGLALQVGVFCAGETASWYLYVTSRDATATDVTRIEGILDAFGHRASLDLSDLMHTSLHIVLAGPLSVIRQGLRALQANSPVH